jgi:thiamine-phosphate pyrophosphorylase
VIEFAQRRLYLCTPARPDLADFVAAVIDGGVDLVQLRDKRLEARELLAAAKICQAVCEDRRVPFILNDRPDLALELGADGVHVGQDDAPVSLCRRLLGPEAIIGLSTHAPEELDEGCQQDVTYLSAGPVEATPTKPGRPGTGLSYVAEAVRRSPVPVFVTGGVTPATVGPLAEAGVRHFVVVRHLTEAAEPFEAARRLRSAIDVALGR